MRASRSPWRARAQTAEASLIPAATRRNDQSAAPSSAPTTTTPVAVTKGPADSPNRSCASPKVTTMPAAAATRSVALDSEDKFIIFEALTLESAYQHVIAAQHAILAVVGSSFLGEQRGVERLHLLDLRAL